MKKKICYGISLFLLGMLGCTTPSSNPNITPTTIVENAETPVPTKEEKEVTATPTPKVEDTKTDRFLEVVQEKVNSIEMYNAFNRKLSNEVGIGTEGLSQFCVEETTGDIYFVNQGKDYYLYRIKEGEVELAVALPVKQLYSYQGLIYFMISDYNLYELQDKKDGDIYCYHPENDTVELVYAAGAIENSGRHKLTVNENGIYFFYYEMEGEKEVKGYTYHLPFGETEPIRDTKLSVMKGWEEYFLCVTSNNRVVLMNRLPKEDGTRETIELPMSPICFYLAGDMVYSVERTHIVGVNLSTGEELMCDFLEAIQQMEGEMIVKDENILLMQSFVITENAVWVTTGAFLYRMDLQSGKISCASILDEENKLCNIKTLYTDGKEIYGLHQITQTKVRVVRILTDNISEVGATAVTVQDLTE